MMICAVLGCMNDRSPMAHHHSRQKSMTKLVANKFILWIDNCVCLSHCGAELNIRADNGSETEACQTSERRDVDPK